MGPISTVAETWEAVYLSGSSSGRPLLYRPPLSRPSPVRGLREPVQWPPTGGVRSFRCRGWSLRETPVGGGPRTSAVRPGDPRRCDRSNKGFGTCVDRVVSGTIVEESKGHSQTVDRTRSGARKVPLWNPIRHTRHTNPWCPTGPLRRVTMKSLTYTGSYSRHTHTFTHSHIHTHTHFRINTHPHTHTHCRTVTYTHSYTHSNTHVHIHTYTHTHTLVDSHTHTHTHTQYTHSHTRTYIYAYSHTHTHTLIHLHKHSHTHTCTNSHTHTYSHTHFHTYILHTLDYTYIHRPPDPILPTSTSPLEI